MLNVGRMRFLRSGVNVDALMLNVGRTTRTRWTTWFMRSGVNVDVLMLNDGRTTRTRWTTWFLRSGVNVECLKDDQDEVDDLVFEI